MNPQTDRERVSGEFSKPKLVPSGEPILYNSVESKRRQARLHIMRDRYHDALGKIFRDGLIHERDRMGITQEAMAEILAMSHYGYTKLECGKSSCGGVTLSLFLVYCCSDREQFIHELAEAFDDAKESDYAKL